MLIDRLARFEEIYEAYSGLILAYAARRTGEVHDAADVVAETFTVAWRRIDEVPDGEGARPWLYGVARRVCANQRRGLERRRRLQDRLQAELGEAAADPSSADDQPSPGLDLVAEALAQLSDGDRELLTLVAWDGLSREDIAAVLGCSPTAARDGEALAAELREFGIDVEIRTLPSSPSLVGEVEVFAPGGGDYIPAGLSFGADGSPDVFNLKIDPNLFTERLTIELHVAARDGEPYQLATSVFNPGEVLGGLPCALGEPLRAEDLPTYLADLELTPVWTIVSPTGDPSITDSEQVQAVPRGEVLSGFARDASTVEFNVVADGVSLPDFYATDLSDVPCTPEQAAAWD